MPKWLEEIECEWTEEFYPMSGKYNPWPVKVLLAHVKELREALDYCLYEFSDGPEVRVMKLQYFKALLNREEPPDVS